MKAIITKKELALQLGVSPSTLRRWLNELYFKELSESGYDKTDRILKPRVLQWLREHLVVEE